MKPRAERSPRSGHSSAILETVAWAVLLVAAVTWYARFRVLDLILCPPFVSPFHGNDFFHLYLGSWLLAHGMDPYDAKSLAQAAVRFGLTGPHGAPRLNPYVYLPFTGLVLSPLTLFSPPSALRAWFALNHLFLFASFALVFPSLRLKFTFRNAAMAASLAALCFPLHRTLSAGQLNGALLFLFSLVYALDRKGRRLAAGAVAAFAFLFKLMPGILFLYFAWRALVGASRPRPSASPRSSARQSLGGWSSAAWMAGFTVLFLAGSVCAVGFLSPGGLAEGMRRHGEFRETLPQMAYGRSTWSELGRAYHREPANQSFNSFFHHVAVPVPDGAIRPWFALGPQWADSLTRVATAACYALAAWALWPWRRRRSGGEGDASDRSMPYAVFILLGLLTPSIYWDHYALIALWPLMAFHARLPERERTLSFAVFLLVVLWLGACLELRAWQAALFLIPAAALGGLLAARNRTKGIQALLWSVASAMLFARFMFDYPAFREGAGLLAMSLKLWGTLILFGLCVAHYSGNRRMTSSWREGPKASRIPTERC